MRYQSKLLVFTLFYAWHIEIHSMIWSSGPEVAWQSSWWVRLGPTGLSCGRWLTRCAGPILLATMDEVVKLSSDMTWSSLVFLIHILKRIGWLRTLANHFMVHEPRPLGKPECHTGQLDRVHGQGWGRKTVENCDLEEPARGLGLLSLSSEGSTVTYSHYVYL